VGNFGRQALPLCVARLRTVAPVEGLVTPRADRPRGRSITPECKLAILAEYDGLTEPDEKGAVLRREGLYSSHPWGW
jgi:transposase